MAASKRRTINPLWPHYVAAGTMAVTFLTAVLRFLLLDWSDRNHCHALTNEGQWLDGRQKNWQPEGCMLNRYNPKDAAICLSKRRVVFVGDSTVRQLYFAFANLVDPMLPSTYTDDGSKHADHSLVSGLHGLSLDFVWDPYLNTSQTHDLLTFSDPRADQARSRRPALVVLGSGLWYLRNPGSGGLPAWESMVDSTFSLLNSHMPGSADEIVFLPVEEPVQSKMSPDRQDTIHISDVEAMNSDLIHRVSAPSSLTWSMRPAQDHMPHPPPPVIVPLVFNEMLVPSQTTDGLHFSKEIVTAQVNILLNHRCNKELPQVYPFSKTCCKSYPVPSALHLLLLVVIVSWGLVAKLVISKLENRPKLSAFFPAGDNILPVTVYGLAIGLVFLADRTSLWDKEQKQFDVWVFWILILATVVGGLATVTRSDDDPGFLHRDQTDEWKGWMQIVILIYHYYGASQISGIYAPVRVLVASYLFMTGYGHFTYYYRKADYSFRRIAQVLVRLNLLTITLAYTMNTDYLFYYFAPLVSFWFMIIYFTMYAGYQYNDRMVFLIPKILLSAALLTWITHDQWIMAGLFRFLQVTCRIEWSAREWLFRVNLDLWIVWVGALTSLAYIKFREMRWADHPLWPTTLRGSIIASVLALVWYGWFELSRADKFVYNGYHPYISFIPIFAFIVLRNATPILRSATSHMFTFIGRCSLETFILQYHIWLGGDTKGILLVIPRTRYRPLNLVISTIIFIYVSHKVAGATTQLTSWICGASEKKQPVLPTATAGGGTPQRSAAEEPPATPVEDVPLAETTGRTSPRLTSPVLQSPIKDVRNSTPRSPQPVVKDIIPEDVPLTRSSGSGSPGNALVARFAAGWKKDVRVRLGVMLLGMWVLNVIWPLSKSS